jgi:hypothetical protein
MVITVGFFERAEPPALQRRVGVCTHAAQNGIRVRASTHPTKIFFFYAGGTPASQIIG